MNSNNKVLEIITNQIISKLEEGTIPWRKTWNNSNKNIRGNEYRGINRLILSLYNFESPYFLTFLQVKELGGYVRKGAHGIPVIFWKMMKYSKVDTDTMEVSEKNIPFMRYYTVFNLSQTENIDMKKLKTQQNNNNQSIITAEEAIANWQNKPEIVHRGSQPCYIPARDIIEIPDKKFFTSADSYYQTFYHEAVHSTGHKSRLARKEVMETSLFRGAEYGLEELVAEVGACFLSSATGIKADIDNTAAYVKSWLRVLNDDPKMIITAAARAEKAMDHILGTAPEPAETQE